MGDWIEWKGGECPVPGDTLVDVRHADGAVSERTPARDAYDLDPNYGFDWWRHIDLLRHSHGFIVAYRLSTPTAQDAGEGVA